jgi:bacterial microcompartment shell protein
VSTALAKSPRSPEALCLIELSSIAAGTRAADALVKRAPVTLERAGTLQPGKFALLFSGDVASVEHSHRAVFEVASAVVTDHVLLPHVEPTVYQAVVGRVGDFGGDTLGVVETASMAATVDVADAAVKGASVRVVSIRLGDELGGKGVAHFVGEHHDVEAALDIARTRGGERLIGTSITPRIDDAVRGVLARSTRFWGGG